MKKKYLRKTYTRAGAAVLAALLALPGSGVPSVVSAADQTQMTSAPEMVYSNAYSDDTVRTQDFDENWKFYLGDAQGAETENYDDSAWKNVNLPHDYSIEQEYSLSNEAESGFLPGGTGWYRKRFTVGDNLNGKRLRIDFGGVYMDSTVWLNGELLGSHPYGYTPFSFDITDYVDFGKENVITVKVDHRIPSSRFYSGSGIYRSVDLVVTDPVHVDLYGTQISTPKLETEKGGTVKMSVNTTVANDGDSPQSVVLTHTVFPKDGDPAQNIGTVNTQSQSVGAGSTAVISAELPAAQPKLWSVDEPNLYTVRTEVKVGNEVVDTYDTDYGFRYFNFDKDNGFSLNGENMKLKGVCMHHDQGSLGSEAYYRSTERQVELLKKMGCNAIRVTHNPASNELIEACNKHGIMLVEEAFDGWFDAKNGNSYDYARFFKQTIDTSTNHILGATNGMEWPKFDLTAMIRRGYNAPAIIMWSLGNEVWEGARNDGTDEYVATAEKLAQWAKELDPNRPATIGDNKLKASSTYSFGMGEKLYAQDGVIGANYCSGDKYDEVHQKYPNWPMYGSETASATNSRGIYNRTANNGDGGKGDQLLTAYDKSSVGWGAVASDAWYTVIKRDYLAGEFVWTGFDYIGEPTPYNGTGRGMSPYATSWPSPKNSFFGIIDTAGFPKDTYYFYQSQWNDDVNTLHILPAWNENVVANKNNVEVVVYTDAAAVELQLTTADGETKTVGQRKEFETKPSNGGKYTYQVSGGDSHQNMYLTWNIPFEAGTLTAVAYDKDGKQITKTEGRSSVTTAGAASKLKASVDRDKIAADGKDLAYITVDVTDEAGNIVPDAADKVTFKVEGDGVLVGVDNGKQTDHQSYQDDNRQAFSGKVLAIVQSTKQAGSFTVTASADGLESSKVTVTTESAEGTTTQKKLLGFYMPKNYYVKTGSVPSFPATVEARYTDGSTEEMAAAWGSVTSAQTAEKGTFTVNGTIGGKYTVSVTVNVIDEIGALLNYSTTVSVGTEPQLPDSRPAIMPDGTDAGVSLPVTWQKPAASAYANAGTVVVEGTANVFGQTEKVTASVRVQQEELEIGESVSGAAALEQNIGGSPASGNLNALKDGVTNSTADNAVWTNKNAASAGVHKSEITFEYATQQRLGEIVVHFIKNQDGAVYPAADATKVYVSENGEQWQRIRPEETIGTEKGGITPYTYDMKGITATFVKLSFTDNNSAGVSGVYYTGATEIELKTALGELATNNTADLSEVIVNGMELTPEEIAAGEFTIQDAEAVVTAQGADNAAATVLPAYNDRIRILVQAEDHVAESEFIIYLNGSGSGSADPDDPENDKMDYPRESTEAFAVGSQHPTSGNTKDGPKEWAVDGKEDTWWHSAYANDPGGADLSKCWIVLKTDKAVKLDALRYLARSDSANGRVTNYKVEYSSTGEDNSWTEIAVGEWEDSGGWKLAKFTQPVETQYVKLTGVATSGAGSGEGYQGNKFMTAVEIRLRKYQEPTADVERTISVKKAPSKVSYVEGDVFDPTGLEIEVKTDGQTETVAYSDATKADFRFTPLLGKALKGGTENVNVFYGGASAQIPVTVTGIGDKQELRESYDKLNKIFKNVGKEGFDQAEFDKYKNNYTTDSFAAYEQALSDAKDVLGKEDATEQEVQDALDALDGAYKKLTPKKAMKDYTDMKSGWYVGNEDVEGAYKRGLMLGKTDTTFAPGKDINRAEVAIVIYRMGGLELALGKGEGFKDTQVEWMKNAVVWANHEDIVTGYTDTNTFRPANAISRQELALMLYRYASYQGYDTSLTEAPGVTVHWEELGAYDGWPGEAETAMKWCVAKGIITGNNGRIDATGKAVRVQAAIMFNRFMERFE